MMNNQLVQILEKTFSPNNQELAAAKDFLQNAIATQYPAVLSELSKILANSSLPPTIQMQAGLQLKNVLHSDDVEERAIKQNRWLSLTPETRQQIKADCFQALGTQEHGFYSAAHCVAHIACAEIPTNQWPDVMPLLVSNVTGNLSTETLKEASLNTIGYICCNIDPNILTTQSDHILTAIIFGMKKDEPSYNVKLAATEALLNSLEFTRQNFDNENERNYIMQVVCEATQCADTRVSVAALECLVKIMSLYYTYMEVYMPTALFAITVEAMKSTVDNMVLQGIEFWSTVCEEEIDISHEVAEAQEQGTPMNNYSKYYARGAVKFLVPLLLEILEKLEEGDDDNEWNPHKAAGVCLALLAEACEGAIVELVLPYLQSFIRDQDWKRRNAAIMAFGSILGMPVPQTLEGLVTQAMPVIIELLADPSASVRDTTAWTVGRVCEVLPQVPLGDAYLPALLLAMIRALTSEPKVATNVCWAFSSLAEGAYTVESNSTTNFDGDGQSSDLRTYKLSPYFGNIIDQLIQTTNRADCDQSKLRNASYSALMEMMKYAPKDCYSCVQQTTMVVLQKMNDILQIDQSQMSNEDCESLAEQQSLLCGTLASVLPKFDRADAMTISDQIMTLMLILFERIQASQVMQYSGVQEEALLVVSALVNAIGPGFGKYLVHFFSILLSSLKKVTEKDICCNATGLVGDLVRNATADVIPFLEEIINVLFDTLRNPTTQRSLLPHIINVFGDCAMSVGDSFIPYHVHVVETLKQACQAEVDLNDRDMVDYLNLLRQSCIDTFVSIIQGAGEQTPGTNMGKLQYVVPHMGFIVNFIEHIGSQQFSTDDLIGSCCGLVGDIVSCFGKESLQLLDTEGIRSLLTKGKTSKKASTKKYALWASKQLSKLKKM